MLTGKPNHWHTLAATWLAARYHGRMATLNETSLYLPVKRFLEEQGFEVKGEVQGCDLVAVRGDDLLVVELKLAFSLALVLQGVDRLKLTDLVYLAIPAPRRAAMGRWSETIGLCRRLGLGLLTVHFRSPGGPRVEVVADPGPYAPRQVTRRRKGLLGEFARRSGDRNVGGGNRRTVVTAYREEAMRVALELREGPRRVADVRTATGCDRTGAILSDNYYGWFAREERGVYALTEAGTRALVGIEESDRA